MEESSSVNAEQTIQQLEKVETSTQESAPKLEHEAVSCITASVISQNERREHLEALCKGLMSGNCDAIKVLLESLAPDERLEYLKAEDENGRTAVHLAAYNGCTDTLKVLLESLAPDEQLECLKAVDDYGVTALHWAAVIGRNDTVKVLLESIGHGERLECLKAENRWGITALYWAVESGNTDTVKVLLESVTPAERLVCLKAKDELGMTALHLAAVLGPTDKVKVLLESIEPDERPECLKAKDEDGRTALHLAAEYGRTDAVKVLLESVAPDERLEYLKAKDRWSRTALCCAAHHVNVIKYFLESTEPHVRPDLLSDSNQDKDTVLLLMAKKHNSEVICQVLRMLTLTQRFHCMKGQGMNGQTILHALSSNRQKADQSKLSTLISLTGRFAPELLKIIDSDGKTPADVAETGNIKELLTGRLETYNLNKALHAIIFYTTHNRLGALEELETLSGVLTSVGCLPDICQDFSKDELLPKIYNACSQCDISGLIVFIMTHGDASSVCDQQGQPLDIQDIILALGGGDGIPKVLILQACRDFVPVIDLTMELRPCSQQPGPSFSAISTSEIQSNVPETNVAQSSSPVTVSADAGVASKRSETFHVRAGDVLVVCATLHECRAKRNHFIPILAKYLEQSTVYDDFYTVVKKTNKEMREMTGQVPEFRSTMDRSLAIKDFVPEV